MRYKAKVNQTHCVACGCCLTACKKEAIQIIHGCYAQIDPDKCVGCKLCSVKCPASIISMEELAHD